jgi:hypothetical protein
VGSVNTGLVIHKRIYRRRTCHSLWSLLDTVCLRSLEAPNERPFELPGAVSLLHRASRLAAMRSKTLWWTSSQTCHAWKCPCLGELFQHFKCTSSTIWLSLLIASPRLLPPDFFWCFDWFCWCFAIVKEIELWVAFFCVFWLSKAKYKSGRWLVENTFDLWLACLFRCPFPLSPLQTVHNVFTNFQQHVWKKEKQLEDEERKRR